MIATTIGMSLKPAWAAACELATRDCELRLSWLWVGKKRPPLGPKTGQKTGYIFIYFGLPEAHISLFIRVLRFIGKYVAPFMQRADDFN